MGQLGKRCQPDRVHDSRLSPSGFSVSGLKPSKKKIVNLITKGKYSSGKKKPDVFEEIEIETEYSKMIGAAPSVLQDVVPPPRPPSSRKRGQQYQNMTARVEELVSGVKVRTPETPEPAAKKGPPSRPPPPKAKPSRPPPPKKAGDVANTPAGPEHETVEPPAPSLVIDELADFFGTPIPVAQEPAKKSRNTKTFHERDYAGSEGRPSCSKEVER